MVREYFTLKKIILFGYDIYAKKNECKLPPKDDVLAYSYSDFYRTSEITGQLLNGKPVLYFDDYPEDYDEIFICSSPGSKYSIYDYLLTHNIPKKKISYFGKKINNFLFFIYKLKNFI